MKLEALRQHHAHERARDVAHAGLSPAAYKYSIEHSVYVPPTTAARASARSSDSSILNEVIVHSGKYALTHPQFSAGYQAGRRAHTHADAQANEYSMLYGAMLMRGQRETAFASASWGAFQLMGFNHRACGFATANDFAQSMCRSAANQLDAFLEFCKSIGAARYLANKDWAGFANRYNGPDYRVNHYDTNLAAAYRRFGGA